MTTHADFTARGYTFLSFEISKNANGFRTTFRYIRQRDQDRASIVLTTIEHKRDYEVRQWAVEFGLPVAFADIDSAIRTASEGDSLP